MLKYRVSHSKETKLGQPLAARAQCEETSQKCLQHFEEYHSIPG